jgi:hypothetical protein
MPARAEETPKVKPVIAVKAQPFPLSQVRLLDGHPWEVAHNPYWTVTPDGRTLLREL